MTTCTTDSTATSIAEVLDRVAGPAEPNGPDRWRVELPAEKPLAARLRCDDGWLSIRAEPRDGAWPAPALADLQGLLRRNASLAGGAKIGLYGASRRPVASAEVPFPENPADLEPTIDEALAGIRAAADLLNGQAKASPAQTRGSGMRKAGPSFLSTSGAEDLQPRRDSRLDGGGRPTAGDEARDPIDLGALCAAAGWNATDRADHRWAVPLEVGQGFHEALVVPTHGGGLQAICPLDVPCDAPPAQHAIATLLLTANEVVRLARAVALDDTAPPRYAWQAAFVRPAGPEALHHALAALSVALRMTAREAPALANPRAAHCYLNLRGWSL